MLIDLTLEQLEAMSAPRLRSYGFVAPQRVYRGVYDTHINFHNDLRGLIANSYPDFPDAAMDFLPYGIMDHWEQLPIILLDNDPRRFVVGVSLITKDSQPRHGGFRFHKWGPYIGRYPEEIQHEYLYDSDLDEIYVYHVFELKGVNHES